MYHARKVTLPTNCLYSKDCTWGHQVSSSTYFWHIQVVGFHPSAVWSLDESIVVSTIREFPRVDDHAAKYTRSENRQSAEKRKHTLQSSQDVHISMATNRSEAERKWPREWSKKIQGQVLITVRNNSDNNHTETRNDTTNGNIPQHESHEEDTTSEYK